MRRRPHSLAIEGLQVIGVADGLVGTTHEVEIGIELLYYFVLILQVILVYYLHYVDLHFICPLIPDFLST